MQGFWDRIARTDQFHRAIVILNDRRTAFHPVASIEIFELPDFPNRRSVDMAADHSVDMKSAGIPDDRLLELADKTDDVLYLSFDVGAQRPVAKTEHAAKKVYRPIALKEKLFDQTEEKSILSPLFLVYQPQISFRKFGEAHNS